ncbi:putative amid-like NADH oxidoreductase [Corynespora cassiicola Philippines]|uniref:Putative amid-like NADH oxidoreductase n=1 Tax=Corynespora cassiicola Philippines TaxID=1448308 RepID=A0A2T2NJC4_CORCC|nr:putative amid-like NADH oxidoreductase [Corynespora cassiicola Philippines]
MSTLSDKLALYAQLIPFFIPFLFQHLRQRISAFLHKRAYKPLPPAQLKNVVVLGGSFAGVQITKRLADTLPTGYRVVLVERNSHLNYLFAFPRFGVVPGYEKYAFIPYEGIVKGAPEGIYSRVQGTVVEVSAKEVVLEGGERVAFEYLVVATGTEAGVPNKVLATEKDEAEGELRSLQEKVVGAKRIAVVGGGAVGVEVASDIKSFFPEKDVAIIHSRAQLLNSFGSRLHEHVVSVFEEMGIAVLLNERPVIPAEGSVLRLFNGKETCFDLIIPCTGQKPNSSIVASLSPELISKQSSHLNVKPTLQVDDDALPHIFAFGDVANTSGPKMARAAFYQSEVVLQNLLSLIHGKKDLKPYKPQILIEGAIKLTLGKSKLVTYMRKESGREYLIPANNGAVDMGVQRSWRFYGADPKAVERKEELDA